MTEVCWVSSFQHKHIQSVATEVEFRSLPRRGISEGCSWPVLLTQSRRFSLFVSLCLLWACTTGEDANHPALPSTPPAAQQGTVTPAQPQTVQPEPPPSMLADTEVPRPTASVPDLKLVPAPDLSGLDPARAEHLKAAYQSLQAAIARKDLSPKELSEAYSTIAQLYHTYNLLDAAQICYENVGQLAPQNFAWRYARADILRRQGKVADALADYEAACKSQPKNIPCLIHQGRAHLDNHNTAKAGELFTRALALDPQAAAAHEGLGYVAHAQEHYQEAAQHFEAALALVPAANRLHDELATLYQHLNDSEKAQAHLEQRGTVGIKVVDALTEQLEALIRGERIAIFLGRLAFYAGHYDEAATQFTKAVEADPRNATARVNLAMMLVEIGKSTTAITQLQEALRLQPALGSAHYNLAVLLLQQPQRLPDAIYHFRAALVADPTDRQLYVQLANALQRQGEGDEALIYAMKAADLDPTDEKVLLRTAALLVQRGYYAEARQRLEDAHQRFPKRGGTAHALAHLLATCPDPTLRDGKRALNLAQRVFAAQNSAPYAETVALAFAEVGQCNEAAKWQRALLTAAEKKGEAEITKRFKTDLGRYENSNGGSCRPPVVTNTIPTEERNTVKK